MQRALNIVQRLYRGKELSINPDKMNLLLFVKRKQIGSQNQLFQIRYYTFLPGW
jgi:hypothetical protein